MRLPGVVALKTNGPARAAAVAPEQIEERGRCMAPEARREGGARDPLRGTSRDAARPPARDPASLRPSCGTDAAVGARLSAGLAHGDRGHDARRDEDLYPEARECRRRALLRGQDPHRVGKPVPAVPGSPESSMSSSAVTGAPLAPVPAADDRARACETICDTDAAVERGPRHLRSIDTATCSRCRNIPAAARILLASSAPRKGLGPVVRAGTRAGASSTSCRSRSSVGFVVESSRRTDCECRTGACRDAGRSDPMRFTRPPCLFDDQRPEHLSQSVFGASCD